PVYRHPIALYRRADLREPRLAPVDAPDVRSRRGATELPRISEVAGAASGATTRFCRGGGRHGACRDAAPVALQGLADARDDHRRQRGSYCVTARAVRASAPRTAFEHAY